MTNAGSQHSCLLFPSRKPNPEASPVRGGSGCAFVERTRARTCTVLTSTTSMDGGTSYPSFVHSLAGGDLCITDMRTHALHVLTLAGDFKRTIDASGALQFAMGITSVWNN